MFGKLPEGKDMDEIGKCDVGIRKEEEIRRKQKHMYEVCSAQYISGDDSRMFRCVCNYADCDCVGVGC